MRQRSLYRPSPALVISCIALAVALSGTGYAVTALPRNSVGTAQLKKNAVNSTKVKDRSLRATDFARGQLPAGPQGSPGPQGSLGPMGPQGPKGDPGATNVVVRSADRSISAGGSTGTRAMCNTGERATGGGGRFTDGSFSPSDLIYWSAPTNATGAVATADEVPMGWDVAFRNGNPSLTRTFRVFVVCSSP